MDSIDPSLLEDPHFKKAFEFFSKGEPDELIYKLFSYNQLYALKEVLKNKDARDAFFRMSDQIQRLAVSKEMENDYISILPMDISLSESDLLYEFLIDHHDDFLIKLASREIAPSARVFRMLCSLYNENPSNVKKDIIKKILSMESVSWRQYMYFSDSSGISDVVYRLNETSDKTMFILASILMNDNQKIEMIKGVNGMYLLGCIVDNMDMPEHWQKHLPKDILYQLLKKELNL